VPKVWEISTDLLILENMEEISLPKVWEISTDLLILENMEEISLCSAILLSTL
jgi:hypothetical protein